MPYTSGDWRKEVDYDYFDDLSAEQTAFEFLRRDVDYGASYAALRTAGSISPAPAPKTFSTRWGLRFAIDPSLHGNQVSPVWLAKLNPGLALLTHVAPDLVDGLDASATNAVTRAVAEEGRYVDLTRLPPPHQALILPGAAGCLALLVPMDGLFTERMEAAARLWQALTKRATIPSIGFTTQRRSRLKLIARALDGSLAGADYREIARGLFGERVPTDAQWRTSSIRSQTIRLVKDGLALMRGGYLRLLRADRRER